VNLLAKYESQLKVVLEEDTKREPDAYTSDEINTYWAIPTSQEPSYFGLVGTKTEVLGYFETIYLTLNADNPAWHPPGEQTGAVYPKIQCFVATYRGRDFGVYICVDTPLSESDETFIKTTLGITQLKKRSDNFYQPIA
jgi:hypothetical protein